MDSKENRSLNDIIADISKEEANNNSFIIPDDRIDDFPVINDSSSNNENLSNDMESFAEDKFDSDLEENNMVESSSKDDYYKEELNDTSSDEISKEDIVKESITEDTTKENNDEIKENATNDELEEKRGLFYFLNNRNIYTVLILTIFTLSCILVGKMFYLKNKVNDFEELIVSVEKENNDIKYYLGNGNDIIMDKKGAASNLTLCLSTPPDIEDSAEVKGVIEEINNFYNSNNNYFAFVYKDIYTGFTVSYNENQSIFTASAIKGPTDIYIYEMASVGKVNLNENLTYTSSYYNTGSGLLKNKPFDTSYSVKTLLEYSTVYSDNAAHNMLTDHFGRENMYNFWKEKGTTALFSQSSNWGVFTAKDCSIYMTELYDFYTRDDEYGSAIMNNFMNAIPKFISSNNNYRIANKSGWSGSVLHDIAIVFDDNPYIVVALSNTGATKDYMNYFNEVSRLSSKLHKEYWKYKMQTCDNIEQY